MEIAVRARPRAARPGLGRFRDGLLEVRLAAPPVDGAANAELVQTLAAALGLPRRAVTLVAGEHARIKRLRVEGLAREEVLARLGLRGEESLPPRVRADDKDAAQGRAADAVSATRRARPGS